MIPVRTENTNHNFGPPLGHENEIGDLPCQIVEERGYREVVSVWQLSQAERDAIAHGYNVRLGVGWIGAFPPVSLGVTHEARDNPTDKGTDGAALIAAERRRQIVEEGWSSDHDDDWHDSGQLARAAAVYAAPPDDRGAPREDGNPPLWPWRDFYKPTPDDRVRELVKAGALIAAEIDRLQRSETSTVPGPENLRPKPQPDGGRIHG